MIPNDVEFPLDLFLLRCYRRCGIFIVTVLPSLFLESGALRALSNSAWVPTICTLPSTPSQNIRAPSKYTCPHHICMPIQSMGTPSKYARPVKICLPPENMPAPWVPHPRWVSTENMRAIHKNNSTINIFEVPWFILNVYVEVSRQHVLCSMLCRKRLSTL